MVGIVAGGGLGISSGSWDVLGASGQLGAASFGRASEGIYVNAATGNLVLRRQDELLVGRGPDIGVLRSYNSQGALNDENGDNWQLGFSRRVTGLTGTVNTSGSKVLRIAEDGAETLYEYNVGRALYVGTAGAGAFDTLSYNAGTQKWTWIDGDSGIEESYNAAQDGRLSTVKDTDGNQFAMTYTDGRLTKVESNGAGQSIYIDYDSTAGRTNNILQLRTVSAGQNRVRTSYTYDELNRLQSVRVDSPPEIGAAPHVNPPPTYITTYTYDGSSRRVLSVAQSDGRRLDFKYVEGPAGKFRIQEVHDTRAADDIRSTRFDYVSAELTTIRDALDQVTELRYDSKGQLTSVKAPAVGGISQTVSFAYDAEGNLANHTDGRLRTTFYTYQNGNRVSERDALGNTVTRVYSAQNKLLAETRYVVRDPDGGGAGVPTEPLTTRHAYDSKGHMRYSVSAQGRVTEYIYGTSFAGADLLAQISYTGSAYNVSGLTPTQSPTVADLDTWRNGIDRRAAQRTDYSYDARGQLSSARNYGQLDSAGAGVVSTAQITRYVYGQFFVNVNRRLYSLDGSSYRIPDLRIPSSNVIFDATLELKSFRTPQVVDFHNSSGGRVTIVRPTQEGGSYSILNY